jgi:hypothetical protein
MKEYTREDRKELDRKRGLMREALQRCYIKQYDGRPLLKPYADICVELYKIGGRPETPEYCNPDNWKDPERWSKQSENKTPVRGTDDDFNIIRERQNTSMQPRKKVIAPRLKEESKAKQVPKSAPVPTEDAQPSSVQSEIGYYKINISWTERPDLDHKIITKMQQFFDDLGLERGEVSELDTGYVIEKTIEYQFKGTHDGYMMLKRTAMAVLDILHEGDEFKVVVHGKKC